MSTSTQIILSRAVRHHLHNAFVSLLDRIDEFDLGMVLTYQAKPHFWRKKELDFTGAQLSDILTKSETAETGFSLSSETKPLFDDTSDSSQREVDIDLDLDGELKMAIAEIEGDVGGSGKKKAKISVSLGSINHINSNLMDSLTASKLSVNLEHPIVREAVERGKTLFVISSLYQSQKVEILVTREEDVVVGAKENVGDIDDDKNSDNKASSTSDGSKTTTTTTPATTAATTTATTATSTDDKKSDSGEDEVDSGASGVDKIVDKVEEVGKDLASKGLGVPEAKEDLTGDTKATTTGLTLTKRERPSNIAFSVVRIDIGSNGSLTPQAKIGVSYDHKIHASYSDAFVHFDKQDKPSTSGASTTGAKKEGKGLEPSSDTKDNQNTKDSPKKDD